jgi:HSP20 family protein
MSTKALTRNGGTLLPAVFDDFFKPCNEWFDGGSSLLNRVMTVPAVNIMESKDDFKLSFAVPGMKKDDFHIGIDGNMLTISTEKEETREEKESRYTRKEYNYSSFSRSFSLPDEVSKDNIQAAYTDGVLHLTLPKKEEAKKFTAKNIIVK